ncbi:hypothetical protein [Sphingobium sp. Ant17]|uniref:hypothetical protein n=1 Tax=Sphingobium sp. Ant17 TaxID=1461752 RepID=UPI001378D343|nr:hypothetical protein [Sphingobium sp. Ant17]
MIDERTPALRLGIDIEKSEDWAKLLDKFAKPAKYTGVFGTAWPRWWMHKIVEAWSALTDEGASNVWRLSNVSRCQKKLLKLPKFGGRYSHRRGLRPAILVCM